MAYTLVSKKYIPAETGLKYIQGNGREIPRGTIEVKNGLFLVKGEIVPAKFYLCFEDEKGKRYCFDAYLTIKSCMGNKKLTEKRRKSISAEVEKIAANSEVYEPQKWISTVVEELKKGW